MDNSDIYLIFIIELIITVLAVYAAIKDRWILFKEKKDGLFCETRRGEKSMSIIYAGYGASMASALALVTNAEGIGGHRVALLSLDFISITYLFFFSIWFRNSVLFKISGRISKD